MDEFWTLPIDFISLTLVLVAGVELGLIGVTGFSLIGWLFGTWKTAVYDVAGLSALWQIYRQRIT
jgi:uncharacterized membrane protein YuzA (DUF378 family)